MEVVVQWLDDLEDIVFAVPLAWERLRVWCLHMGLLCALILGGIQISRVFTEWAGAIAVLALLSIGVWTTGLVATQIAGLRYEITRGNSLSTP